MVSAITSKHGVLIATKAHLLGIFDDVYSVLVDVTYQGMPRSRSAPAVAESMRSLLSEQGITAGQAHVLALCLPSEIGKIKSLLNPDGCKLFDLRMQQAESVALEADGRYTVERRRAIKAQVEAALHADAQAARDVATATTADIAPAAVVTGTTPAAPRTSTKHSKGTTTIASRPPPSQFPSLELASKPAAGVGPHPAPNPKASPKHPTSVKRRGAASSGDESSDDESVSSVPSLVSASSDSDDEPRVKPVSRSKTKKHQRMATQMIKELVDLWPIIGALFPAIFYEACASGEGLGYAIPGLGMYAVYFKIKRGQKLDKITIKTLQGPYGAPVPLTMGGLAGMAKFYPFPMDQQQSLATQKFIRDRLVSRSGDAIFVLAAPGEVELARQAVNDYHDVFNEQVSQLLGSRDPWGTTAQPHAHPCSLHAWCVLHYLYFQVMIEAVVVKKDVSQLVPLLLAALARANNSNFLTRDPALLSPVRLLSMTRAMGLSCGSCGAWGWFSQLCPICEINSISPTKAAPAGDEYVRSATERAAAIAAFKNDSKHPDRAKLSQKELNQLFNRDAASAPFKEKKPSAPAKRTGHKLTESEAMLLLTKLQNRIPKPMTSFPITLK